MAITVDGCLCFTVGEEQDKLNYLYAGCYTQIVSSM